MSMFLPSGDDLSAVLKVVPEPLSLSMFPYVSTRKEVERISNNEDRGPVGMGAIPIQHRYDRDLADTAILIAAEDHRPTASMNIFLDRRMHRDVTVGKVIAKNAWSHAAFHDPVDNGVIPCALHAMYGIDRLATISFQNGEDGFMDPGRDSPFEWPDPSRTVGPIIDLFDVHTRVSSALGQQTW